MTEPDFDRRLRARLERLAGAVPVAEPEAVGPDRIVRGPVVWAQGMPGRLAVATVLVAMLAIAAWAGGVGRATGPGATDDQGIESVSTDGPFELTIRSARSAYDAQEPIEVQATLAYRGASPGVEIFHGLGASGGPLAFGVVEPVEVEGLGLFEIVGGYRMSCVSSTLDPAAAITEPFAKGGHAVDQGPEGPSTADVQRYFSDRSLRLPVGIWHLYALADFSVGDCGAEPHALRAEITVVVGESTTATATATATATVTATATAAAVEAVRQDVAGDGTFELRLSATRARYMTDEPIDINAELAYIGPAASIELFHASGARSSPMAFGIEEPVVGDLVLAPGWDTVCATSTLDAGTPIVVAFQKSGSYSGDDPQADAYRAFISDAELRLPAGTWHVYAVAEIWLGGCGGEEHSLRAEITIVVE